MIGSSNNRFIAYLANFSIYLFKCMASKYYFRRLLKHVPLPILYVVHNKFAMHSLDRSLLNQPKQGSIGLVTQTGILNTILLSMMSREGLGLSKLIMWDNVTKWDEAKSLQEIARDPQTKVIMICVESLKCNGPQFVTTARKVTMTKPIIAFKSGKSEVGQRAVLSHVGSMAGSHEIYTAAFKQSGVLQAQTLEEMLDFAKALSLQRPANGSKVAIVTNGGGAGIIAADACIEKGLEVPALPQSVRKDLEKKLLPFLEISNPLDLSTATTAEVYLSAVDRLLSFEGVDALILMVYPTPTLDVEKLAESLFEVKKKRQTEKPIVVTAIGSDEFIKHLLHLEEKSLIPLYLLPEKAVSGIAALVYYGEYLRKHDMKKKNI